MRSRILKFFQAEASRMADTISRWFATKTKAAGDGLDDELDKLLLDWAELADEVEPALVEAFLHAAKQMGREAELTDKINLHQLNEAAHRWAQRRAAELVGMKRLENGTLVPNPDATWAITETTRAQLHELVERAFTEGLAPRDLAKEIEDSVSFSSARAEMIARTELNRAQSAGAHGTAKQIGAIGKAILLSNDHDKEDECDDNEDDGVISIDDSFSSGDDFPPFHPNCECGTVFYTAYDPEAADLLEEEEQPA